MDSARTLDSTLKTLLGASSTHVQMQSYLHKKQGPEGRSWFIQVRIAGIADLVEVNANVTVT